LRENLIASAEALRRPKSKDSGQECPLHTIRVKKPHPFDFALQKHDAQQLFLTVLTI
jgi:hypothetical protein